MQYPLSSFVHKCQDQGASKREEAGQCSCACRSQVLKNTMSVLSKKVWW